MFGDQEEGGCDDRGGGADVEGAVAVAARADNVAESAAVGALGEGAFAFADDGAEGGAVDGEGGVAHGGGAGGDYGRGAVEASGVQEGEEGGELGGGEAVFEYSREGEGNLRRGDIRVDGGGGEAFEKVGDRYGCG